MAHILFIARARQWLATVLLALGLTLATEPPATAQPIDIHLGMRAGDAVQKALAKFQAEIAARLPDHQLRVLSAPQPEKQVLDLVRSGAITIGIVPLSATGAPSASPLFQPWLYQDAAAANRAANSEIGAITSAELEQQGFYVLAYCTVAFTRIATRRTSTNLESLRDLKLAVGPLQSQAALAIAELGARPVVSAAGEVYTSLQTAVVDGTLVIADSEFRRIGFAEVLGSYVEQRYQPVIAVILVNKSVWRAMPFLNQLAISKAARLAAVEAEAAAETQDREFIGYVTGRGARLVSLTTQETFRVENASFRAWSYLGITAGREDLLLNAVLASHKPATSPDGAARTVAGQHTILYVTDRVLEGPGNVQAAFNGQSGDALHFGQTFVELRSGWRLDDDLENVASIQSISHHTGKEQFVQMLKASQGEIVVFIHGYNNNFTDAVRRGATIKQMANLRGPLVVFSWPSDGTVPAYFSDEAAVDLSARHFREFMGAIDAAGDRSSVSIIAHSMGSRILLSYLDWAHGRTELLGKSKFKSTVLAASDVTVQNFRDLVKRDVIVDAASRATIYVSGNDRALYASQKIHNDIRIGRATGKEMFIHASMDSIDASDIDKSGVFATRHSYVFDKAQGVQDLAELLGGKEVALRRTVRRMQREPHETYFWVIP